MKTKRSFSRVISFLFIITLELILAAVHGQPLKHDDCRDAIPVSEGVLYEGTTVGATGVGQSSCGTDDTADVWHRFTATSTGTFHFSLCGSGFDTTLAVFDECDGTVLACNDDSCSRQSEVFCSLNMGQDCLIRIAGYMGETGAYVLAVAKHFAPENDECANAIQVVEGESFVGSSAGATGVDESNCGSSDIADVWHRFTATSAGTFHFSLCDSEFDTTLAVFDECSGTELVCNDDSCGAQSQVLLSMDAGQSCLIRVAGYGGEAGNYALVVGKQAALENNECANAIPVVENQPFHGSTVGATGIDESLCADNDTADVWHSYTPVSTGLATFSLSGSEFDATLAVFDECGGRELACHDGWDTQPKVCISVVEGQRYLVRVAGHERETGSYVLTVTSNSPVQPTQPSAPAPADGAAKVPADTSLSWNNTVTEGNLPAPSMNTASSAQGNFTLMTIYGRDDRLDEYQVTDANELAAGDSTAIIVPRVYLEDNGDGTFTLPAETLADWYYSDEGTPLCPDEPFRDQPTPGQCSAFLVTPQIIATAGHCVEPDECPDLAVVFGFVMLDADTPVLTVDKSEVYYCSYIIGRQTGEPDWGLIYLDRTVTGHRPLPVRHGGLIPDGEALLMIGHPMGIPRKYAAGATVRGNTGSGYFVTNVDSYSGSSGSAVLSTDTLMVEGINYAGPSDFWSDGDCDRSFMCPDVGCGGFSDLQYISRTTEFAPAIPLFDVYFGSEPEKLELIWSDTPRWSCDLGPLETGKTYYWQVVSKNCYDRAEGAVWSFTTE